MVDDPPKIAGRYTYFRYSMRFLEPLSLLWCNHIISYGDYLDNLLI